MHPLPGLFFRWSKRTWVPDAATFGSGKDFAEAAAGAMHCGAARASANRKQVGGRLQLPGGNRSRAENSRGYCCQKRVFDCLVHGFSPFQAKEQRMPKHPLPKLFFRWSERPWIPYAPTGGSEHLADAGAVTRLGCAACAYASRKQVG